jgi:hypothetical protein
MALETNFDAAPYFDDFNVDKNFYRVLFKPGSAVQARELTQLQSILQDQIDKFGRHIFKDGSVVEGCTLNLDNQYSFVKITDTTSNGSLVSIFDYVGNKIVSSSNLQAIVVNALPGLESNDPNLNTLYIRYLNSTNYANGSQQQSFDPNEIIEVKTQADTLLATISVANTIYNPVGNGYAVSINGGTIFKKGFFIRIDPQTIVVSKYTPNPGNVAVGFITNESIVTSDADGSLFDNALGSANFSAPGANRLKLVGTLALREPDSVSDTSSNTSNFFSIVEFSDDRPVLRLTDPQYSILGAEMAKRTFEESGNYIVNPFELTVSSNTTVANNLVLEISKGIGYVQGYRVEYSDKLRTDIRKGTDTLYFPNQIITANYGNYVFVNELAGIFDITNLDEVGLYATAAEKLTAGDYSTSGPAPSTQIGTAKIRDIEYHSGIPGTPSCQYKMYLFDINITGSGVSFADVRSVYATDGTGVTGYADAVLVSGSAILRETAAPDIVFALGRNAIQTVNTAATSFIYKTKTTRTFQANGSATITPPTSHPGGTDTIALTGSLSEANELRFIIVANTSANAVNVAGVSVTVNTSSANVVGNSTFTSNFEVGDYFAVGNSTNFDTRRVVSITNTTHLVANSVFTIDDSGLSIARRFPAGVPISFARVDSANIEISSDGSSGVLNLGTNLASTFVASIYYDIFRGNAVEARKNINKNRFVKIQANTHPRGNQGPWSLGIPDVTKVRAIYQGSTFAETNPDLSRFFVVDSGQKGNFYDLANIRIRPGSGHTLGANEVLLVELDHLTPDFSGGIGYFSVRSYPIDDTNLANTTAITTQEIPSFTSETGITYDLRDSIDFRSYTSNTANSATLITDATTNPASVTTLLIDPSGAYSPTPDANFNTAFSYYLGRKDKIALSQDGNISVVEGAPSTLPTSPRDLDGTMTLGTVIIPPYPSLSQGDVRLFNRPEYGISIDLQQHRRYTMRDIGVIDKKIARLEYYTSLSLLETSAKTLSIKDDAGLDRFKNGFVVDPFNGFSVSDVSSPEYKVGIDIKMNEMSPTIRRTYVEVDFDQAASTNVEKNGNLITLTGNTIPYIEQPFASKTRNCVENIIYVWNGNIVLTPEGDAQPDIDRNPDVIGNIDLSGITTLVNALPSLLGIERVLSTTTISTNIDTSSSLDEVGRAGDPVWWQRTDSTFRNVVATTTNVTQREQIDFSASTQNNTFDFGELVQDVSIQTFIRPRRILFFGNNLKPNTRLYAYFDGVAVSQFCVPTDSSFNPIGVKGGEFISDSVGDVYGYFDIPAETFKTGERTFRLADTDDIVLAASAITTQAAASYVASNIAITKARFALNTRVPQIAVSSSFINTGISVSSRTISSSLIGQSTQVIADPIAQSFLITDIEEDAGVFVDKIDLYFRSKHPTLGVELQLREVENGLPTPKIVPFGRKILTSAQVNTSLDASVATSFTFDTPLFLQSGLEYCFVVMPIGSNEEYNIWVGEIGETDISTNTPIYINNSTGVLFTSSTNRIWTPFQREDIKFVIHRKDFTSSSGTIVYKNSDTEYLTANNLGGQFNIGEQVFVSTSGGDIITGNVSLNTTSTSVSVVANATSNAQALFSNGSLVYLSSNNNLITEIRQIVSIPNTTHIIVNTAPTFSDSIASAGLLYSNGELSGVVSRISLDLGRFVLDSSTANSIVGFGNVVTTNTTAILIGSESRAKANLVSVDDVTYSTVVPQFSYCSPIGTSVNIQMKGFGGSTFDSVFTAITSDIDIFFSDRERVVKSRSNELASGGQKTYEVRIPITSISRKTSPFFDDIKSNIVAIENIICACADISDEIKPQGGAATAKYVSKRVVLAEGQDAEDLNVYLSAYKPSNTNIAVFAKFLNGEDFENIDQKSWTPLNQFTAISSVSSRVDRTDFREFVYDMPSRRSVNIASSEAMSDYPIYGTFSNTDISSNTITISNTTPLDIGSLVFYIGDVATGISNGFYNILTSNTTAIKLSDAGTSTEVSISPSASGGVGTIHFVVQTAFKDSTQNDVTSYYTRTGALFTSYKTFTIKIVLTSEEGSHLVPRVSDMRAIALQA